MKSHLLVATIAAAALLLLTGPSSATPAAPVPSAQPAHPSVRTVHDPRRDVVSVTERAGKDAFTPAPNRRHGDIVALRVSHRAGSVVTRVTMRRLTRDDRFFGAAVQLRTSRATYSAVVFRFLPGRRLQQSFDGGGQDSCAGMSHHLSYRHDTITITVPRACLGSPTWVRPRAVVDYFGPGGASDTFFADGVPGTSLTPVPFLARVWHPGA